MQTTTPPDISDPRGLSAMWLGLTGASLLVAAATVFVAVRWDELSLGPRSAILAAVTGLFMLTGRRLAAVVPNTGSILFHVGALLVAIDTAALVVALGASIGAGLLAGGVASVALHGYLGDRLDSIALQWAARVGAVVASGGLALVTALPAGVVLGLLALLAVVLNRDEDGVVLATVAALAPFGVLVERLVAPAVTPFAELGYTTSQPAAGFATAALAAIALGVVAHDRREPLLAVAAIVAAAGGFVDALTSSKVTMPAAFAAFAATLVLFELLALRIHPASIWFSPMRVLRLIFESLTGYVTVISVFGAFDISEFAPALAVAAVGFLLAEQVRNGVGLATLRDGSDWWFTALGVVALIGAVVGAIPSGVKPDFVVVGVIALAAILVMSPRAGRDLMALTLISTSIWMLTDAAFVLGIGLCGAAILLVAASNSNPVRREFVALGSILPLALAAGAFDKLFGSDPVYFFLNNDIGIGFVIVAFFVVSIVADRARPCLPTTGAVTRLLALAVATVYVFDGTSWLAIGPGAAVVVYALAEALHTRSARDLAIAGLAVQAGATTVAFLLGVSMPYVGTTLLVVTATIAAGAVLLPKQQRLGLIPSGLMILMVPGLMEGSPHALADALIIIGLSGAAFATALRANPMRSVALAVATAGTWIRLGVGGVDLIEVYVAPFATLLLVNGIVALRRGESSWVTVGPAMALLATPAAVLLLAGADHASVHVAVLIGLGMVGLLVGAQANLAAPLFIGTTSLATAAAHGVLAAEITVPTWVWLACAGSLLVGAAMSFERRSTTPVEAGRQLVANVQGRFR